MDEFKVGDRVEIHGHDSRGVILEGKRGTISGILVNPWKEYFQTLLVDLDRDEKHGTGNAHWLTQVTLTSGQCARLPAPPEFNKT